MAKTVGFILLFMLVLTCQVLAEEDPSSFEHFKNAMTAQMKDMNMRIAKMSIIATRNEFYVQKIQYDLERQYKMLSKKIKDVGNTTRKDTDTQTFRDILCDGFPEKFGERLISATDEEKKVEEMMDIIQENIFCDEIDLEFIRDTALLISEFDISSTRLNSLGDKYKLNDRYLEAILLYYAGAMQSDFIGDDGADDLENAIHYITVVVDDAAGTRQGIEMIKYFALPFAKELLEKLKNVKYVSPDFRARVLSTSHRKIGAMYMDIAEYKNQLDMDEKAIVIMMDHFGEKANEYKIFGYAWNNACVALGRLGQYEKAIEKCSEALLVYEEVLDWSSQTQKRTEIERTERNIKNYQANLKEEQGE